MSPRAYRSTARQAAASDTRRRILDAAREVMSLPNGPQLTIDAVAEGADVARMTVYNQFGSKAGLVDALLDEVASRGGIGRLPEAFRAGDARTGLRILVEAFTRFWASERDLLRRLRAMTVLDPELSSSGRDQRRRQALGVLLRRLAVETGRPAPADLEAATDLLLGLTSFETYEILAEGRSPEAVVQIIVFAVYRLLGVI